MVELYKKERAFDTSKVDSNYQTVLYYNLISYGCFSYFIIVPCLTSCILGTSAFEGIFYCLGGDKSLFLSDISSWKVWLGSDLMGEGLLTLIMWPANIDDWFNDVFSLPSILP